MRTIHFYLFLSLTAIGIFSCQGCDDDEVPCNDPTNMDCHNYDPCHDRKAPVSADFEVRLINDIDDSFSYVSGDTILADSRIKFVALDSTAGTTYQWQVGNPQNVSSNISYLLSFPCRDVLNQSIPVRLIAERLTDSDCLPEADRRDTLVRVLHFVSSGEALYWGTWKGTLDGAPNNEYSLELIVEAPFEGDCGSWTLDYVRNIKDDGTCIRPFLTRRLTYHTAWFDETTSQFGSDGCAPPPGFIATGLRDINILVNGAGDSIQINFTYMSSTQSGPGTTFEDFVFKGRRVE